MSDEIVLGGNIPGAVMGSEGDDNVRITGGTNIVLTVSGDDAVTIDSGYNKVDAGEGNDSVTINAGTNKVDAGAGNDSFTVTGGLKNTLAPGSGLNRIDLQGGNNRLVVYPVDKARDVVSGVAPVEGEYRPFANEVEIWHAEGGVIVTPQVVSETDVQSFGSGDLKAGDLAAVYSRLTTGETGIMAFAGVSAEEATVAVDESGANSVMRVVAKP